MRSLCQKVQRLEKKSTSLPVVAVMKNMSYVDGAGGWMGWDHTPYNVTTTKALGVLIAHRTVPMVGKKKI